MRTNLSGFKACLLSCPDQLWAQIQRQNVYDNMWFCGDSLTNSEKIQGKKTLYFYSGHIDPVSTIGLSM